MLQDAKWFWEQAPILQNVQFPWRLLGPVAICMALVIAQLGRLLPAARRWRAAGMAAALALLIVPNLSHLHSKQLVDVDLNFWTPEQLSLRGFETTTMAEVTPRWMPGLPCLHSGRRHGAFRRCRDPPAGPRAVLLVKSG